MTAQQEMAGLFERWLKLTQAEAGAIENAAWSALGEIQAAKDSLQKLLSDVKLKWNSENPRRASSPPEENPFYPVICRLLSMETRNAELLASKINEARATKKSLDDAVRNLQNIRQSYAVKPAGLWTCYS
jgi:hypothetical protein